jgi:hypothetical protein
MRNHRMRGYGAWCQGWRDAERLPPGPPHKPGILFWGFIGVLVFTFLKVTLETGNPMGILLGLAVLAGVVKGLNP